MARNGASIKFAFRRKRPLEPRLLSISPPVTLEFSRKQEVFSMPPQEQKAIVPIKLIALKDALRKQLEQQNDQNAQLVAETSRSKQQQIF